MAYNWDNSMAVTIEKWDELLKELANYTYQTYIGATTDYYTEIADDDAEKDAEDPTKEAKMKQK